MATHKECIHFTNECKGIGWCDLKHKAVNANDMACPNFSER